MYERVTDESISNPKKFKSFLAFPGEWLLLALERCKRHRSAGGRVTLSLGCGAVGWVSFISGRKDTVPHGLFSGLKHGERGCITSDSKTYLMLSIL